MKKYSGMCLPYGNSQYHDTVAYGAFDHQDGEKVPLLRFFGNVDDPENVIGHCVLHKSPEGMMCTLHFNKEFEETHSMDGFCSYYKIGAWATNINREPVLIHKLPYKVSSANGWIITYGKIRAVIIDDTCLEPITIEEVEE